MRLHTAHLTFGKVVPANRGILFLDITVKSGGSFAKRFLAPSWELLQAYKRKAVSKEQYSEHYVKHLFENREVIVGHFTRFLGAQPHTDVVLGCYCGKGEFCHRHLLKRFLLAQSTLFEPGGELQNGNLYAGDEPKRCIVSIAASQEVRTDLLTAMSTDIGSHVLFTRNEGELATEVRAAALDAFAQKQGPLIDLSDHGNRVVNAGALVAFESTLPEVDGVPWYVLHSNDKDALLIRLRELRFEPACDISMPVPNPDFDEEMDQYYQYGEMHCVL